MVLRNAPYEDDDGIVHVGLRWAPESEFWFLCDPRLHFTEAEAAIPATKPITCLTCLSYQGDV